MFRLRLLSIFGLLLFLFAVQASAGFHSPESPKTASKVEKSKVEKTASLDRSSLPGSLRLFRKACEVAGIKLKQCLQNLATSCIDSDTQSMTSDDYALHESTGDDNDIIVLSPEEIIERTLRKSCYLSTSGAVTLAVENIEDGLFELSNRGMKTENLEHEKRRDFLRLFRIWFQLPPIQKGQQDTLEKIKMWLTRWPDNIWLDYGLEILVDMLGYGYQLNSSADSTLPGYYEIWMYDILKNIGSSQAQQSIGFMVKASAAPPQQQEFLLREAILTGYSHPLPYLRLIGHLVSGHQYEQASHIYEMYCLAVPFNSHWYSTDPGKGDGYWHEREVHRLQGLYHKTLTRLREQQRIPSENNYPNRKLLEASLEHWPEATRSLAEDMLFTKGLEVTWSAREQALSFSEPVIERSLERWYNEGKLSAMAEAAHSFIKNAYAPRALETLHSRLATMLARLGREGEATDLLYGFVDAYKDGLSTDYDLALYLIASAHNLNHKGKPTEVPAYSRTLDLVRRILASGQREALKERLISIRNGSEAPDADLASLQQLFNSIPAELTQLRSGGNMDSYFEYNLQRALEEARDRQIYTGKVPSIPDLSKLNSRLTHSGSLSILLSQLSSAFRHAGIEKITELYMKAVVSLNKQDSQSTGNKIPVSEIPSEAETIERKENKERMHESMKSRLNPSFATSAFDGNRILHLVPGDGLCLYHSLAVMYGLDKKSFIMKMLQSLEYIQAVIQANLNLEVHPYQSLTPTQTEVAMAIMMTPLSPHHVDINELQTQINSLNAALTLMTTGEDQGSNSWFSFSLLNAAAVVLNEHFNINSSLFVVHSNNGGQATIHEFHSDGHSSTHTDLPGNEQAFLMFNQQFSHFMPVTSQEIALAQVRQMLQKLILFGSSQREELDQQILEIQRQMNLLNLIEFNSVITARNGTRQRREEIFNNPFGIFFTDGQSYSQ